MIFYYIKTEAVVNLVPDVMKNRLSATLFISLCAMSLQAQSNPAKIAVGAYHSVVLNENGQVFTFGFGGNGVLGQGGDTRMDIPRALDHPTFAGKTITDISLSYQHALFLTSQGEVYGLGNGYNYEFGSANRTLNNGNHYTNPVLITHAALDTATIVQVATGSLGAGGGHYSMLLSDKGTVFVMGVNSNGYVGIGSTTNPILDPTPMDRSNMAGEKVVQISTSGSHTLLLTASNKVYAVGSNANGQFGNGGSLSTISPVLIPGSQFSDKTIQQVAAMNGASMVLATDGTVFSWGNHRYSLGQGPQSVDLWNPTPVTHPSLEGKAIASISSIPVQFEGALLVATDGSVYAVGDNPAGQSGNGTFMRSDTSWTKIPSAYFDNKPIVEAVIGSQMSLFRATDGSLYGAGHNAGTGYSGNTPRPLPIITTYLQGKTISRLTTNHYYGALLASDGTVFIMDPIISQIDLINGTRYQTREVSFSTSSPTLLSHSNLSGHTITDVKAGGRNTYLLTSEGRVFSFGFGANGTLGNGDSLDVYVPTLITHPNLDGKNIVDIAVNWNRSTTSETRSHALLLADDGTLFAMGSNHSGQLGVGDFVNRFVPTPVTTNLDGKTIVQIAVAGQNSMAIASDGTVFLWGEGGLGEMGFGHSDDLNVPTLATHAQVEGKKVTAGAIGFASTSTTGSQPHYLVLTEDGLLYAFGDNGDGQLGVGVNNKTDTYVPTPVLLTNLPGETIVEVEAGYRTSMLRTASGKIYSWGFARLVGFETSSVFDNTIPTLVLGTSLNGRRVVSAVTQQDHSLALLDEGRVLSFGMCGTNPNLGCYGALGIGHSNEGNSSDDYTDQRIPGLISDFTTYMSPIPTTLLALHLDASRGFVTSNDSVSSWRNLTGSGHNAVHPALSFRPLRADSVINHRPALRFNGTNSYFTLPTTADLGIQNNDYEVFIVAKSATSNTNPMFLLGGAVSEFELKMNIGVGLRYNPRGGVWEDRGTDGTFTDATAHLFNASANASQLRVAVNRTGSTQNVNGQSSYAGNLNLGIGLGYSPQYHFAGDIAEVIIYNGVLSEADRNTVETHLFSKYGIQNYRDESAQLTGTQGWRLLSTPVADSSYASFFRGLWTQGFTGASVEHGAPNVYTWPLSGSSRDSTQWTALTDASAVFPQGNAVLAYIFSDDDGPGNGTDVGFPKSLRADGFTLSADVNLSAKLNPNVGGWSLIGNPFTTNINWNQLSKANLSGSVYVWDNSTSQWRAWNGTTGGLANGHIGPFNGFFVETMDADPTLTVPTSARVEGNSVFLGKEESNPIATIELTIQNKGGLTNSSWIQFTANGLYGKDRMDAIKLVPLSPEYVQVASFSSEYGKLLDINHLPLDFDVMEIPVDVISTFSEEHQLMFNIDLLPMGWKATLRDNVSGTSYTSGDIVAFTPERRAKKSVVDKQTTPVIETQSTDGPRFTLIVEYGETTDIDTQIPVEFGLSQNYPNPFNPSTVIAFQVGTQDLASLRLTVYDMLGREVAVLIDGPMPAGAHRVTFDASNLSSGVYIYRLQSAQGVLTRKMVLIK